MVRRPAREVAVLAMPMNPHTLYTAAVPFEGARYLEGLAPGHRAARLHGHGFVAHLRCALHDDWAVTPGAQLAQLKQWLAERVGPLDYRCLNALIHDPSDDNIARWLRGQFVASGLVWTRISVQSTARQGAWLDAQGACHVWRRYAFEAAHRLPRVRPGHPCGRMHGHGFDVLLEAAQPVTGEHLDTLWAPLQAMLDYHCLNDLPGLDNPTSEMLSLWIWQRLHPQLPLLSRVTVFETASCGASHDGRQFRIWKDMAFDSACQLRDAPPGSRWGRLHGHTYRLRLHLSAPLDQVMGWTLDFGDVKQLFGPVFELLDHQPLHAIAGLQACDTASLARWILARARMDLPQLGRVDLFETRDCGVLVSVARAPEIA